MKKPNLYHLSLRALLFLMAFFAVSGIKAQAASDEVILANDVVLNDHQVEFDIYVKSTNNVNYPVGFPYGNAQYRVNFNNGIRNGANTQLFFEIIAGSSELTNPDQVNQVVTQPSLTQAFCRVPARLPVPYAVASIISNIGNGTKIFRIRLTSRDNTTQAPVPFVPNSLANFAASITSPGTTAVSWVAPAGNVTTCAPQVLTTLLLNLPLNPPAPPTAYNVTGGGAYCQGVGGLPVGLDGSQIGVNYTLTPGGTVVAGTGAAISFGNQLAGTYTVSGTSVNGNTPMNGSAVISENPSLPITISIVADANNICAGTTVNYTATPVNEGATPTYQWYVNAVAVGTALTTYSYIPANNDLVSVVLTSSLAGCTSGNPATSNIVTMLVSPPGPAGVSVTADLNPSCGSALVTFTATPVNGGLPTNQWYVNAAPVGTNLATYAYVPVNGDLVYVVMTSSLACATGSPATSNTVTMTVNTPVVASVSMSPSANPVCAASAVTFTAVPTNGGTPTYQWYNNTLPVGLNLDTYSYIPANNDQVYVVMTSNLVCTTGNPASSGITTMTVNALPVLTVSGPASVCINSTGNVYTTEAAMTGYTWAVSAGGTIISGGTATDNSVTVTWNTAGPQTVSVNYTNANTCTATSATVYNVNVNLLPVPTITGPSPLCVNTIGNVYTTEAGMSGYTWTVSGGGTITAGGSPANNTVTVTWNNAGPQTVLVNYINANSCAAVSPTVYNVTVDPLPVPTVTGQASVCVNSIGNIYTTEVGMSGYNWTISAGGTITAGAGTNVITVTWNTPGAQTVSVNYTNANSCTAPVPSVYNVTVNTLPVPAIAGPNPVCESSTGNVYTTQAGMSGYIWTVSTGGTITAGAGTSAITVTWTTTGAKTVSVNYTNANSCTAPAPTVYNVTVNSLPVPTLSGLTPAGVGTSQVYTTEAGMTNYVWTVSAGGTITAGGTSTSNTVSVLWNTAGAQSVSVNYNNANICSALAATVYPVNVISIPPAAGTITGTSIVCQGATGVAYSVPVIPNSTGYVWTLPVGATIATGANTNSITVNYAITAVSGIITVYGTNTFGNGLPSPDFTVTVNTTPVPTISGSASACTGVTGNVYSTQAGNTSYIWTVSAGGTITAGAGTNAITVTWTTAGAKTVSVNYSNTLGCPGLAPALLNVNAGTSTSPTIQGPVELCSGATGVSYTTEPGFLNYTWTISYGGIITAGLNTNEVTVTWNTAGQRNISVNYYNPSGCGAPLPYVHDVMVLTIPVPVISGDNDVCQGTTDVIYTTQSNNSDYMWTVSSGGAITAGAGTNSITVSWNASGNQTVSVSYSNDLGCAAIQPTVFNIAVAPKPATAVTITGTTPVCAGTQGVVYSVAAITNATSYNWTVPAGATIASGTNTNSITVNFALNASTGVIKVNGVNDCGSGASSPNFNVVVNPIPATPVITQQVDTLISSANTGNQWYLEGVAIAGATGKKHRAVYTGNYTVVVTLSGCSSAPSNSILVLPVSVSELTFEKTFEVYPNPNNGRFDIKVQSSQKIECILEIYNSLGSLILKQEGVVIDGTFSRHIDLNGAPTGAYMVVLRSRDNSVVRKVVITK